MGEKFKKIDLIYNYTCLMAEEKQAANIYGESIPLDQRKSAKIVMEKTQKIVSERQRTQTWNGHKKLCLMGVKT